MSSHLFTPFKSTKQIHKMFVVSSNKVTPYKYSSKKNLFYVQQPKPKIVLFSHNNTLSLQNHITKDVHMNLINNTIINEAKFKRRIKLKFSITKPNPLLEKKLKKAKDLKSKNKRNANISNGQNKKEFSFET